MRALIITGGLLAVLGIAGLVFGGVPYQEKEQVLKVGPIEATAIQDKTMSIPQPISIALIVIGAGAVLLGVRKRS
jgi:hypothetical protein